MKNKILFIAYALFISYLVMNTGIMSDDYLAMRKSKGRSFTEAFLPKDGLYFLETPVEQVTHYTWYHFFSIDNQTAANSAKIFYMLLSFYLISKFFGLYMVRENSYLASFLFMFFPLHESTAFFFICQYLTLSFAFYLYAFYLAQKEKLIAAFLFAGLASFISYGSFPIALALFILCLFKKQLKKGLVLVMPNVFYTTYYLFIIRFMHLGTDKFSPGLSLISIAKNLLMQLVTFIDAFLGPSMWLKLYYGLKQISVLSLILSVSLIIILYRTYISDGKKYDKALGLSLAFLIPSSFILFSFSGMYPQLAFNLGNRVTIFGSMLVSYIIVMLTLPKKFKFLLISVIILCIFGVSDHWKRWSLHQQQVINNIKNNSALKGYKGLVYVSGNQYSKYGPLAHIEFLSEDWVADSIFKLSLGENISAKAFNRKYFYKDDSLLDKKYDTITPIGDTIAVYDSENNVLLIIGHNQINAYIDSLRIDKRHWIQLIDSPFIRRAVAVLMPRLEYAL